MAAGFETLKKAIIVRMIAIQRNMISIKAKSGIFAPKKIGVHKAFRTS